MPRLATYRDYQELDKRIQLLEKRDNFQMMKWDEVDREMDELRGAVKILLKMAVDLKAVVEQRDADAEAKLASVASALDACQKEIEAFTNPVVDHGGSTGNIQD